MHEGFVDLQVNGYAGVDFNRDGLSADQLHGVCQRLRNDGVRCFLPTIITDDLAAICRRLQTIVRLRAADDLAQEMIPGLHVEGPFLNAGPGYIGAHPVVHARDATVDAAQRMLDAGEGLVRLVTLAPERDPDAQTTAFLRQQKVVVAAGHTDASLDQFRRAIDAGLSVFTHLGNGCPGSLPRHDNIVQRVLHLADQLWITFIVDGHHVPLFALRNYLKLTDPLRTIVVTDAIAAAGLGPGVYRLGTLDVEVTEDGAAWAPGRTHFAGAAVTMRRSSELLARELQCTAAQIRALTQDNPARLIGLVE